MSDYISVDLRRLVREQFSNRCAYCQTAEALSVAIFEIEHILPRAAGGETEIGNLCLSCPTCNRYKGVQQTGIDTESGSETLLFHPHKQEWTEHFKWSRDGETIIGLTATGRATIEALRMNRPQIRRIRRMWVKLGEHPSAS